MHHRKGPEGKELLARKVFFLSSGRNSMGKGTDLRSDTRWGQAKKDCRSTDKDSMWERWKSQARGSFLNGCGLGKSQRSAKPREKDVALVEAWWDNNLDTSFSCEEEKVKHLWLKTLNLGMGKQEDVYWPEIRKKINPPPELYQLRQVLPGDLPSPPTLSSFLLQPCLPPQLSVIIWMSIFSSAKGLTKENRELVNPPAWMWLFDVWSAETHCWNLCSPRRTEKGRNLC